jgi:hypothetical protein
MTARLWRRRSRARITWLRRSARSRQQTLANSTRLRWPQIPSAGVRCRRVLYEPGPDALYDAATEEMRQGQAQPLRPEDFADEE